MTFTGPASCSSGVGRAVWLTGHALIFTRTDGETKRLEDLKGKIIAFEDPESTSGYFLPKLFLTRKGFTLSRTAQIDASVSSRGNRLRVRYFSGQTDRPGSYEKGRGRSF